MTSVLIVDDEPAVRDIMARWVASLGLRSHTAGSADEALATLRGQQCELAVIDVTMPERDGIRLAHELQRAHPNTALVLATTDADLLDTGQAPLSFADLIVKPFQRDRFELAVDRGRRWRKHWLEELRWQAQLAVELEDRIGELHADMWTYTARGASESAALMSIAQERIPRTAAHSERVARYAVSVAAELGLAPEASSVVESAARFHDIGKAAMPLALLTKPSPLTPGEAAIMRKHVEVGADVLLATTQLAAVAPLVHASHESFDGTGYPDQLAGEDIPLESRIIAVCDSYDAMTQSRLYRRATDSGDAVRELLRCSPSQFDPRIVDAFIAMLGRH